MDSNKSESNLATSTEDIICCDDVGSFEEFKLSDSENLSDIPPSGSSNDHLNILCNQSQRRGNLIHSVSIIVEPAMSVESDFDDDLHISPPLPTERRKTIAGPISILEDLYYGNYAYFNVNCFINFFYRST